jgi:cyclopropane fatty-acyl-phospholipid synthase-like methyltransferase
MLMMTFGAHLASGAIYAAAQLRVADHLKDGPRTADEVARAAGSQPQATRRLLRALTVPGVVREEPGGRFALTPLGATLRSDTPDSMRDGILMGYAPFRTRPWEHVAEAVRTGQPTFAKAMGAPVFEYFPKHPEDAALFDASMTALSAQQSQAVAEAYDFAGVRTVMDVAGGRGHLLATVLRAHPSLRGVLFEMPHVAPGAQATFQASGLADRVETLTGDMFQSVPAGGDAYMLKHIIHDWDDAKCLTLLKNVRKVIPPNGKLLVVDMVVPGPGEPHLSKLLDLEMLVMAGGLERTREEFAALFQRAGFRLARVVPTRSPVSVVEGVPA